MPRWTVGAAAISGDAFDGVEDDLGAEVKALVEVREEVRRGRDRVREPIGGQKRVGPAHRLGVL